MIYPQGNCLTGICFSSHVLCKTTVTMWSHQISLLSSKHFFFWGMEQLFREEKQFDVRSSFEPWELGLRTLELELSCCWKIHCECFIQ